jgi:hypothetical protein
MGYSEFTSGLGNGCDSCATVPAFGMGLVDPMSSTTGMVTTQGYSNQYGPMVSNQVFGQSVAGYSNQPSGNMGNGSRYTPGQGNNSAIPNPQVAAVAQATQAVAAAVSQAANNAVAQASKESAPPAGYSDDNLAISQPSMVEGFGGSWDGKMTLHQTMAKSISTVLLIACALALNEFMKYIINKSIQTSDGTHLYYLLYSGLASVVGLILVKFYRGL